MRLRSSPAHVIIGEFEAVLERHPHRMARPESELPYSRDSIHRALLTEAEAPNISIDRRHFLRSAAVALESFIPDEEAALVESYQDALASSTFHTKSLDSMMLVDRQRAEAILQRITAAQDQVRADIHRYRKRRLTRKEAFWTSYGALSDIDVEGLGYASALIYTPLFFLFLAFEFIITIRPLPGRCARVFCFTHSFPTDGWHLLVFIAMGWLGIFTVPVQSKIVGLVKHIRTDLPVGNSAKIVALVVMSIVSLLVLALLWQIIIGPVIPR